MKKRLLAWILALVMLAALLPTAVLAEDKPTSGTCGAAGSESSVTWKFENGTVTISGTGAMADYGSWRAQPWAAYADQITKFVVEDGVTNIGAFATNGETKIEEYVIGKDVATIGTWGISADAAKTFSLMGNTYFKVIDGALLSADGTELYAYPGGMETVEEYVIPSTVTTILGGAFNGADMRKLFVPSSVTSFPTWSFQGCKAEYIDIDAPSIPGYIFTNHLSELKELRIGANVKIIDRHAFGYGDTGGPLEKVTFDCVNLPTIKNFSSNENYGAIFLNQKRLTTVDLSRCSEFSGSYKNAFKSTGSTKIGFYFGTTEDYTKLVRTNNSYGVNEKIFNDNAIFAVLNGGIIPSWEGWYSENFKLATPIRDGYKFIGWYKDADFKTPLDEGAPVSGQTYYAGWEESKDTIDRPNDKPENEQMTVDLGTVYSGDTKSETVPFKGEDTLDTVTSERNYFEAEINGMTVTIKPAADLQPGTYTDTLYVRTAGGAVHFITVTVKIVPKPADPEPELPSWITALPALEGSKKLPFTDVWRGDWYYDGVRYVFDNDLMNGTSGTEFSPNAATTRGMIVTILARMDGVNTSGTPWYEAGREWAMWNGISDGTNMEGKITREQLAAMLTRYAALKNRDVSAIASISAYADASNVSNWAVDAMRWAVGEGLIQGSNNHLRPQSNATRAEVATILMRFCKLLKK